MDAGIGHRKEFGCVLVLDKVVRQELQYRGRFQPVVEETFKLKGHMSH